MAIKESRLPNLAGTARWNRIKDVPLNRRFSGIAPEAPIRASSHRVPVGQMPKRKICAGTPLGQIRSPIYKTGALLCCATVERYTLQNFKGGGRIAQDGYKMNTFKKRPGHRVVVMSAISAFPSMTINLLRVSFHGPFKV